MAVEKFSYDNRIVKYFALATAAWGMVGFLVGLLIAIQLFLPEFNLGPYLTYGRLRPLHTNSVIFAFVGNGIFMGVYHSLQRLCKARMWSDRLSWVHFWGWQLIILLAAISLPMGITTSKEYAELEWPIDILIAVVWVAFAVNMFGTIIKRRVRHMYVAIWFYIATVVTVAVLHIVNSLAIPVSLTKSYPIYAGVQDALVQWWYGHNAVAFFLTTPYLGLMYYYLPKAANRPVFSYRLSIVHFWSLIFIYIWAGPHHLLYTSLPNWAQSLGVVFSLMLIAPSWGGMLNGLLTLRGAWDKVRQDPVLKFMVVAITAYGMATFEGPMLSLKSVNAISHYTDWTIAHVHVAALGWNGFLTFGILYWLIPRLWNTNLYSIKLANYHFWIGFLAILFYAIPLYWAGIAQGLMWKQFNPASGMLEYLFMDTVTAILPMYRMRAIGGSLFIIGALLMAFNFYKTVKKGHFVNDEEAEAPALIRNAGAEKPRNDPYKHQWLERSPIIFIILTTVVILIGGLVELIPMYLIRSNVPTIAAVMPYTPLELEGRDIYIREGCSNCHSQMIRPFRSEVERYGDYSKAGEYVYDRPFLWGSKRTGPDLWRVSSRLPSLAWHYIHMVDPQKTSAGSIMPPYPWLAEDDLKLDSIQRKLQVMQNLGAPYSDDEVANAEAHLRAQAEELAAQLRGQGIADAQADKEIIALIAYLMRIGTDIKP